MQQIKDWLDGMGLVLFLSMCGGMAFAAKTKERSIGGLVCCCIVAVFSGLITALVMDELARYMPVSDNLKYISVSLASFSGGRTLEAWIDRMTEMAGVIFGKRRAGQTPPEDKNE